MSEDKSDKRLPARYHKTETAPTPIDKVHTSVHKQSLVGRMASAFVARLNKHTIDRHTEEVDARTKHKEAETKLAEATLKRDRTIDHYLTHRDDIIRDDHEQHLDEMEANREARLDAKEEREHKRKLRRAQWEQELNQATFTAATTRFGLEVYNQTRPLRLDQLLQKAKEGTLDAELDMLVIAQEVAEQRNPKESTSKAQTPQTDGLERMLTEVDYEIREGPGRGVSDEGMSALYTLRARLSALIEQERNQSQ